MATTYKTHTNADGSKLIFDYPFPAFKTEDVKVALNGGLQATTKYTVTLAPAEITFNNTDYDSTLQENTGAPKSGVKVRIFRNTEVDNPKGVFAAGSSIRAIDLNNNVDQALYALQEEKDQPLWDVDFEGGTINGVTIGGTTPAAGTFSNLTISNLDSTIIGANTAAAGTFTHGTIAVADINGGAIDSTIIGANTAAPGTFTSGTFTSVNLLDNQKIKLGSSADDFDIYFTDASSGQAYIETGSRPINLKSGAGVVNIYAGSDPLASFHTTSGISFYRSLIPDEDDHLDLGSSDKEWKDLYIDGTAYLDTVDIDAGAIDGTAIGANSASTATFTGLTATGTTSLSTVDINAGAIDGTTIGANSASTGTFTGLTATGTTSLSTTTISSLTSPSVDINGGYMDGVAIGETTKSSGKFTTVDIDGGNIDATAIGSNTAEAGTFTDLTADNIDGAIIGATTAAAGTFTTGTITTADINGGNIDGTTIGATTAASGSFTDVTLTSTLPKITTNTSNGSDDKTLLLCGGGNNYADRGALIGLYGNETNSNPGEVLIFSGQSSTSKITLAAGPSSTTGLTVTKDGDVEIPNDLSVTGTLTVSGTTTTLNTSTLEVEDKNITLAKVSTPTDVTADGGGITIKGATDKTFNWVNETDAFTSSEHIHLAADDKKLLLGAASTDAEIYYNGNTLVLDTEGQVLVESASHQNFKIGSAIRLMLYEHASINSLDGIYCNWPVVPGTNNTYDLGTDDLEWKDIYIDGTAYLDTVDIDAGAIDGTIIGANTAAAGSFTNVTLTSTLPKITTGTADGSDDKALLLCGGGNHFTDRGALIGLYGNETSSNPGDVLIFTGKASTSKITFATGPSSTTALTLDENQKVGIGTATPTNALDVQGGTSNTAIVARSTDAKAQISLVDNTTTGVGHVVIGAEGDALFLTSGAGVTALTLDSSQNAAFAGHVNLPTGYSLQWGDTHERIEQSDSTLEFFTGNSEKMTLSGSNLGIGTTSPSRSLHISNNGSDGTQLQITGTSDSAGIKFVPASGDTFEYQAVATGCYVAYNRTDSRGDIFVDGNGKVGLGTASPSRQLHIHEPSAASAYLHMTNDTTGSATTDGFSLYVGTDGQTYYRARETTGTHRFYTGATEALTIASTGNATFSGTAQANQFALLDNKKATFGDSNDLSIWHGESNSGNGENANYISSASGRNLVVQVQDDANGIVFHKRTGTGLLAFENLAVFTAGGSNSLYYDGSKKLHTFSGGVKFFGTLEADDSDKIKLGDNADLEIYHDGDSSYITHTTSGTDLIINAESPGDDLILKAADDINIRVQGNETAINCIGGAQVELYHANNVKLRTTSSGAEILSQEGEDANLFFYADEGDDHADMWLVQAESDGFFALKNYKDSGWEINLKATGAAGVELYWDNSPTFQTTSYGAEVIGTFRCDALSLLNNEKIQLGSGGTELEIYHGSDNNSYIKEGGSGNLYIYSANLRLENADGSKSYIEANDGGAVQLYHDEVNTFKTDTNGIFVLGPEGDYGALFLYADEGDNQADRWLMKADHVASGFYIQNYKSGSWEDNIKCFGDGAVELYYDGGGTAKLETYANGVQVNGSIKIPDSEILRLGNATNGDLKIYFDGTHSRIAHIPATGDLVIQSDDLYLTNGAGTEYYLRGTQNGAVKLYYDSGTYSTAKLETTAGGVNVTGNLLVSTSTSGGVATIWNTDQTSQTLLSLKDTGSGAGNHSQIEFHTVNGQAGNIVSNNVSVAYNTSSDYRLKENEVAISDGITRLKTLKPYRFNFKTEPSKTVDGFFAHEVTPAVPEAITGEKDGTEMQGIDQSKLVPLLTAALQEAIAKIEVLETKVAALEAG